MQDPSSFTTNSPKATSSVKNILTRYGYPYGTGHSEQLHLLKYFPKYYRCLTLYPLSHHALRSKVKKIKRLKRFSGNLNITLPKQLWFNLLKNHRKEIEEMPGLSHFYEQSRRWYLKQELKFFSNVKRLTLPEDIESKSLLKKALEKSMRNMRSLKSLEIRITDENYDWGKWILDKLNKTAILLGQLENLSLDLRIEDEDIHKLFENKNVLSHLTGLDLGMRFNPIVFEFCKSLKFLSVNFALETNEEELVRFLNFLTCLQSLSQLRHLELNWPAEAKHLLGHFKPPASLYSLKLGLPPEYFTEESIDLVTHWEDLKELDSIEFVLEYCRGQKEIPLMKRFITTVLLKIRKLRSLKCTFPDGLLENCCTTYEPFFVGEVGHLYECLENFEHNLSRQSIVSSPSKFDLKRLNSFRNLKVLKLKGSGLSYDNLLEVVGLLEGNQKQGKSPIFEIQLVELRNSPQLVKDILMQIKNIKNLKMKIKMTFITNYLVCPFGSRFRVQQTKIIKRKEDGLKKTSKMKFQTGDLVALLEKLCKTIQSIETIKGLVLDLHLIDQASFWPIPAERMREVLRKYPEIGNIKVSLSNREDFCDNFYQSQLRKYFFVNC